jgi:hypothetical protein
MRQREVLRRRRRGQIAALFRGEVFTNAHGIGQRAFTNEKIAVARLRREAVGDAGIASVDDVPRASLHGICHTLSRVWDLAARKGERRPPSR